MAQKNSTNNRMSRGSRSKKEEKITTAPADNSSSTLSTWASWFDDEDEEELSPGAKLFWFASIAFLLLFNLFLMLYRDEVAQAMGERIQRHMREKEARARLQEATLMEHLQQQQQPIILDEHEIYIEQMRANNLLRSGSRGSYVHADYHEEEVRVWLSQGPMNPTLDYPQAW